MTVVPYRYCGLGECGETVEVWLQGGDRWEQEL